MSDNNSSKSSFTPKPSVSSVKEKNEAKSSNGNSGGGFISTVLGNVFGGSKGNKDTEGTYEQSAGD